MPAQDWQVARPAGANRGSIDQHSNPRSMKFELEFKEAGKALTESLSEMIKIGDSIFAGSDEGVKLARLEERDGGKRYEQEQMIALPQIRRR